MAARRCRPSAVERGALGAPYASWDEVGLAIGAPRPTGAELAKVSTAPGASWRIAWRAGVATTCEQTFLTSEDGKPVEVSRAWVVWHVLEHDLHHGGEISLTLGMHGIDAEFAV